MWEEFITDPFAVKVVCFTFAVAFVAFIAAAEIADHFIWGE